MAIIPESALFKKPIPLSGKWQPALDGLDIGMNFRQLVNMEYMDGHPRGIPGMTKINSAIMNATYFKARSAFHYSKSQPAESHILTQAWNTGLTASRVLQNKSVIPATGAFESTVLWTDSAGADIGHFSNAPSEAVAYCNSVENCLWTGDETPCLGFINFDPSGTFRYDYSSKVDNTKTDSDSIALLKGVSGGSDSACILLLHGDNNVTDSSPTTAHTVTNVNVTFDAADFIFGTHSFVWTTNAYLTIPDNADFDKSGGVWTHEQRIKPTSLAAKNTVYYQKTDITKFTYDTGSHEPTVGQTLYGETSGAVIVVDYVDSAAGWAGAGTGTIYYTVTSGSVANGEHIHEAAGGAGNLVCNTTSGATDAGDNYIDLYIHTDGSIKLLIHECYGAGSDVVSLSTAAGAITVNTWYHVAWVENGDTYSIYAGPTGSTATLLATVSDSSRAKNYTSVVYLGYDLSTFAEMKGDEIRGSTSARYSGSYFNIPVSAFSATVNVVHAHVRSTLPLRGMKFYVSVANTSASSVAVYEWNGSAEVALAVSSDGTDDGGIGLAQTGLISFTDTQSTSRQRMLYENLAYDYHIVFTGIDATTSIYYVTLDQAMQPIQDIWDGIARPELAFYTNTGTAVYNDFTLNVFANEYDTADAATFVELDSLASTSFVIVGFEESQTALYIGLIPGHVNTTANTVLSLYYSKDGGTTWTSVGVVEDGTSTGGISLSKGGTVSWSLPAGSAEMPSTISRETPLYHLKLQWSQTLSADVQVFYVSGVPTPHKFGQYKYSIMAQEMLLLCGDMSGKKNAFRNSAPETNCMFNGDESIEVEIGETGELMGGAYLYAQYNSNLYNLIIQFNQTQMWKISGVYPDWIKHCVSETIGLAAPQTLKVINLPADLPAGLGRNVIIWQGAEAIYISDGRPPIPISDDIACYFDKNRSECIRASMMGDSVGWFDLANKRYHIKIASGSAATGLNTELVFDLKRWRWFKVNRGAAKDIVCALTVKDLYGSTYTYGFIDTGYMLRLNYGLTFDGLAIECIMELGDFLLDENPLLETNVDKMNLVMVAHATNTGTIAYAHSVNTEASASTSKTISPNNTGYRISDTITPIDSEYGRFHSGKFTISTDDELIPFEPLGLMYMYSKFSEKEAT